MTKLPEEIFDYISLQDQLIDEHQKLIPFAGHRYSTLGVEKIMKVRSAIEILLRKKKEMKLNSEILRTL